MPNRLATLTLRFNGLKPAELNEQIDRMEIELQELGLKAGHVVAIRIGSSVRFIAALFASIRIGAVFCPLNLRLPERAINEQLSTVQPKLLILESEIKNYTSAQTSLLPSSFLLFTSGSNNTPKIVNLSLQNFLAAATSAVKICDFQSQDTWLLSLPLFHVGGLSILFRALLANAAVTTNQSNLEITHLSYVPTQLYRAWPIYPRLKAILLSGAPIHQIPEQLPIIAAYGMTETASMIIGQKTPISENNFFYLGFPQAGKEMSVSPDGEILIKGDSLFQGYWDGLKLHRPVGWFATGDLGLFDSAKGFAIIGRKDNQFISGGENISPEEIEKIILGYPSIIEAIVVAKADEEFGHRPICFLRSIKQLDRNSLKKFLFDRLPKYKVPCDFFSLDDIPDLGLKPSRKKLLESLTSK
jgi:O-succinylbenzoic acid--CoA ligase